MTKLAWDQAGQKTYQAGLDRGVLYLLDKAVAWNGLTGVEEKFDIEIPYNSNDARMDFETVRDVAEAIHKRLGSK